VLFDPDSQTEQADEFTEPVFGFSVPAGQGTGAVSFPKQKWPAGHSTHPASESQYCPTVQLLLLQEHSVSQSQAA